MAIDVAVIEQWIEENTIACPMGRLTRKMCAALRSRPRIGEASSRQKDWFFDSRQDLVRPAVCEKCEQFKSGEQMTEDSGQKTEGVGKYVCELHGVHDGMKLGRAWTAKCPACIIERRSKAQKEAFARKKAEGRRPDDSGRKTEVGELPAISVSDIVMDGPPACGIGVSVLGADQPKWNPCLTVDFSDYPEILNELQAAALNDFRDINRQAIYLINKGLREAGKEAA